MATLQELLNTGNYSTDKGRFPGSKRYFDGDYLHNYIGTYENLFSVNKDKDINFLEIGILNGGSMKLWRDYFTKANIYGVDIVFNDLAKKKLENENVNIIVSNSTNPNSLSMQKFKSEMFDVIIEDGNHSFEAQYQTLVNFFPKLKKGGIYIIEDIEDRTMRSINMLNTFKSFKEFEIVDLRDQDKRADSVLFIFKK